MSIGVDYDHARILAAAGRPADGSSEFGLQGAPAKAFAEQHATDVALTLAQQRALFEHVLPTYEAQVCKLIRVPLTQNQFDALVSFDYSRGATSLAAVAKTLNKGDYKGAADILEHFDDKSRLPGIRMRRWAEAATFRFNAPDGQ